MIKQFISWFFNLNQDKSFYTQGPSELSKKMSKVATLEIFEVFRFLHTSANGLTSEEAEVRVKEFGLNELAHTRKGNTVLDLLVRFKNPLVIQLLVIGILSYIMGEIPSTIIVSGMLFLSVFLSHYQEYRSSKAVQKLYAMIRTTATVVRDGKKQEIPLRNLVPGDIVHLSAGDMIPADVRLISSKDFFVNQSALTGESMPVEKFAQPLPTIGNNPLEFQNACFMGSSVYSGSATAVVVMTGTRTYFGGISKKLIGQRVETSFDKGLRQFTLMMIRIMVVMVIVVFAINYFRWGKWQEAVLFALAVAVGLTPEMLPMIVTVNLSKGALTMSRKKVIVKRLNSIQNFGAMDILCTDKTGTLTQDKIVLERYVDVTNQENEEVLRYAYINSYYQTGLKNLLDIAVLNHTEFAVEQHYKKVDEIPFDFSRRRMSVIVEDQQAPGKHLLICKGALEEIFQACDRFIVEDEINEIYESLKQDLRDEYRSLSAEGFRVLAVAYKNISEPKSAYSVQDETSLILLGFIAFLDPPKETAKEAIELLRKNGVVTKILTGDNELVTRKICREVGLDFIPLVTGDQLEKLSESDFIDVCEHATVFARLTPEHKEMIIRALQKKGHVVGFLGDGINDAPALKTADVGISVDTAVDIAKESADIILLKKSLLVLEDGVLEGRKIFGNIIKYIKMGASSNFGNMFSVVGGSWFLPFIPMAPIQVLVNNLLYDFSQTGIPTDRVDEEYLRQPRKWNIDNIRRFMFWIGPVSSIFDYTTFFIMLYIFNCWIADSYHEQLFHTGWFIESLLTQTLIVHIIRTNKIPFFQSRASKMMSLTTLLVMGIGIMLPISPLAKSLGFVTPPPLYWFLLIAILLTYSILTHLVKTWFIHKYGSD
ncbi:MAG: magnesium-translocating P-type ATPase [bacterium]|nr:magnesium-translocating P-type ATPase [bacterium]